MSVNSLLSFRGVVDSWKVIGFSAPDVHSGITVNVYQQLLQRQIIVLYLDAHEHL